MSALGTWEIAARISNGPPRIVAVAAPNADEASKELAAELRQLGTADVAESRASTHEALIATIVAARDTTVISGLSQVADSDWGALDRARSRLAPNAVVVLVMDDTTASRMAASAPNLSSWLSSALYRVEEPDQDEGAQAHLAQFAARYKMTGDEAIRRAEAGEASSNEPDFAVWLVLLGRGDLARRRRE